MYSSIYRRSRHVHRQTSIYSRSKYVLRQTSIYTRSIYVLRQTSIHIRRYTYSGKRGAKEAIHVRPAPLMGIVSPGDVFCRRHTLQTTCFADDVFLHTTRSADDALCRRRAQYTTCSVYVRRALQTTCFAEDVLWNRRALQTTCSADDLLYRRRALQTTLCRRRALQTTCSVDDVLCRRRPLQARLDGSAVRPNIFLIKWFLKSLNFYSFNGNWTKHHNLNSWDRIKWDAVKHLIFYCS